MKRLKHTFTPTDDIDWLAVWCVEYRHDFGHVMIPKDLDVPPALGQTKITVCNTRKLILITCNLININPRSKKPEWWWRPTVSSLTDRY